jgi:colicin import membrane protein
MKTTSIIIAASLALVPATAFAGDKKKEELAKAKAEAKEKALEAAKAKAQAKTAVAVANAKEKAAAPAAGGGDAAAQAEKETHARNVGAIERLQQIADATNNADLKTIVQRLSDKETKRHGMAGG